MASPEAVYQSVPLDPLKREFRLLILHPAFSQNDELRCSIFHAQFDDTFKAPEYEALSYVWGTSLPSYKLIINGTLFSIRENLYTALTFLRKQDKERVLWIDAICINQNDDTERSQQVQIMYLIYSKASRVIGWLGEEQPADQGAKSAFEKLLKYILSRDGNYNAHEIMQHYYNPGDTFMPEHNSSDWLAINSILSKRWFSRVWIIQEIVMARHLTLHCGEIELDRSVIEDTLDFLSSSPLMSLNSLQNAKQALSLISTARVAISALEKSEPWTIMEMLWVTRNFSASLPRDRLFAFLGVIKARHDPILVPDYTSTDANLYIQWAAHSLSEEAPFRCLSLACPSQSLLRENLPSWVPDWGAASNRCLYRNLTFKTLTCSQPNIRLSDCQKHLTLGGVQLDTIRSVVSKSAWKDEWPPKGTATVEGLEMVRLIKEFIDEAEDIVIEAFKPYDYPIEMFWRTLITNTTRDGESPTTQAPSEYGQSFEAYRKLVDAIYGRAAEDGRSLYMKAMDFDQAFIKYQCGRKFGVTQKLRMGLFPDITQPGDVIFAPAGANVPFVLREVENGRYTLVGECYMHGVMYGEIAEEPGWEANVENFTIC